MATHNSHTHCQVAQADSQTKTWQRVCLFHPTKDCETHDRQEGQQLTAVWQKWRFSASYDSFVVGSSAVLRINICGENRHLRQAAKRQAVKKLPFTEKTRFFAPGF